MYVARTFIPAWLRSIGGHIYTHNPFYLVSACLVLYGLQITATDSGPNSWRLIVHVLVGYTLLLALIAWVVVRFGQVWEDARTILLVLLLLFVALSIGCDKITIDNWRSGARFLAAGFAFAVVVSEGVLASLKIRLAARYRLPYYLQLLLLFAYPLWLSYLLNSGQARLMSSYVMLFPVAAGISLLALLPAAYRGGAGEPTSGTPWRWPWFPWTMFLLLGVGMAARAYSLAVTFETAFGMETGFQAYLLVPLLLAAAMLGLELAIAGGRGRVELAVAAPLGLLLLAFPGPGENPAQQEFLAQMTATVGGPPQVTLCGLLGFYVYAWLRRVPQAEIGGAICLALLALVNRHTVGFSLPVLPTWEPLASLALVQLGLAAWHRSSPRFLLVCLLSTGAAAYFGRNSWFAENHGFYPLHLVLLSALVAGIAFRDHTALAIRRFAPAAIAAAALSSVCTYSLIFPGLPAEVRFGYMATLTGLALVYWYLCRREQHLAAVLVCVAAGGVAMLEHAYNFLDVTYRVKGLMWFAWGMICLAVALLISLIKGGLTTRLRLLLRSMNRLAGDRRKAP